MARRPRPADDDDDVPADEKVIVPHDPVNEQLILASMTTSAEVRKDWRHKVRPDLFIAPAHHAYATALRECDRRGLEPTPEALARVGRELGVEVDARYAADLVIAHPDPPPNLSFHLEELLWDHARATLATGPLAQLLQGLRNPGSPKDRMRSLSRAVGMAFDGYQDRTFLLDPEHLAAEAAAEMLRRRNGQATYPFGIDGLDRDEFGKPRLVPGAAPGMVTVLTGVSGSGKSPVAAAMALGLARQKKKVLYGAWEVRAKMTLEWLAVIALGYDRAAIMKGEFTDEEHAAVAERMRRIGRYVRFMELPFRRAPGAKRGPAGNDHNLDVIQGYIADSACDVFVADLFERCLTNAQGDKGFSEEGDALKRMHAIAEEQNIHAILVAQQRLKDIEKRPDKRPTREGIKGTSVWVEVADNIFGTNRKSLWRRVPDDTMEVHVLKQRYERWPMLLEFDWNPKKYSIANGREVPYDHPEEAGGEDGNVFDAPKSGGRKQFGGRGPRR